MKKILLKIINLWCHYGGAEVLRGISLEVEEGSIVTIIGNNGAGKTTILRTISGLKDATSGEILFQDERIDQKLPQDIVKRGIVHVPEGRALFPYMTVLENLKLGAFLQKNRDQIENNLKKVFEHFPRLEERRYQQAKTLSGGEQQMLAVSRALMANPRLLLLDEPSLGLSPMNVQEIGRIVRTINEKGISIILVEQNARLALKLANRGYVLDSGNLVLHGKAEDLLYSEQVKRIYLGQ
jgi:branched-chain amino acid transport system ATP-binding protein